TITYLSDIGCLEIQGASLHSITSLPPETFPTGITGAIFKAITGRENGYATAMLCSPLLHNPPANQVLDITVSNRKQ
uniref:hypothetical protein n=1 Tax=Escherichia albertii TaxID=208962 RepID=UPI001EDB0178